MYVGPLGIEAAQELLVDEAVAYQELESFEPRTFVTSDESRILLLDFDSVQSKITVYGPDTVFNPEETAEYALYAEMMGGSAGLVFQEIREARSLAYSASGGYRPGSEVGDQNFVWGVVACQADKTTVATELLVDMLHNLPDQAERWERIHAASIQRQVSSRIGFRSVPGSVEAWRRQGMAGDPRADLVTTLNSKNFGDLKEFAGRFRELPFTIVILGDADRLDRAALEAIAPITEVQLEDLLGY